VPTFSGRTKHLVAFLNHYEALAASAQLRGKANIDAVFRYISTDEKEEWENVPSFETMTGWAVFRNALLEEYPGAEETAVRSQAELDALVTLHAIMLTVDCDSFGRYLRRFQVVPNALTRSGDLIKKDRDCAFLSGISDVLKLRIMTRLVVKVPDQPQSTPYGFADVKECARFLLNDGTVFGPTSASAPDTADASPSAPVIAVKEEEEISCAIVELAKTMAALQLRMRAQRAESSNVQDQSCRRDCHWCGGNHIMRLCDSVREAEQQGTISYRSGRVYMANGSDIPSGSRSGMTFRDRVEESHTKITERGVPP
jgi:hypothetical protein